MSSLLVVEDEELLVVEDEELLVVQDDNISVSTLTLETTVPNRPVGEI